MIRNSNRAKGAAAIQLPILYTTNGCEIHIQPHYRKPNRLGYQLKLDGKLIAAPLADFRDENELRKHSEDLAGNVFMLFPAADTIRANVRLL